MERASPETGILASGTMVPLRESESNVTALRPNRHFRIDAVPASDIRIPEAAEYLIKGIIEPARTSIWFGPPGSAKTFLMLHLGYAVAKGSSVFGRKVHQGNTLYCALEGRGGIDKRIYAIRQEIGDTRNFWRTIDSLELLDGSNRPVKVNATHMGALVDIIREHDFKFVIIDTLNLVIGGADENSNSDMGMLLKTVGDIVGSTGAHIAIVAHSAKSGSEGGPRGGSALKGNADLVVSVGGEGVFCASSFAPGGKVKDGAPFNLFFQLNPKTLFLDDDGDPETSCTIEEVEEAKVQKGSKLSAKNQGWLNDLYDMFATSGGSDAPVKRTVLPGLEMESLDRAQVRAGFRLKGRFGDLGPNENIPQAFRQQMSTALNALKDAGKIGMTDQYIWLVHQRQD